MDPVAATLIEEFAASPMSAPRRVVVTGLGSITPVGHTAEETWSAVLAGQTGVGPITRYDTSGQGVKFAAEVKGFDAEATFGVKEARKVDRFSQYAMAAGREAWKQSGLGETDLNREQIGVIVGVGMGGLFYMETQHQILMEKGPRRVTPMFVPLVIPNMAAGMVSIDLGLKGPNICVTTACASGTHSIGEGYHMIRRGDATAMLVGGAESVITPLCMTGFTNMGALSKRNDDPATASRPFDKNRDGFVMGEGAGILVLEDRDHAVTRGANILAEVVGYGLSGDAYHMTAPAPCGEGGARAMALCLESAGLKPEDVQYINAHGTSTPMNDELETAAIKAVFGDHARKLAVNSSKSMIGHLIGAAGAVEAVISVQSLRDQIVHRTMNYETPDPACDLDYVVEGNRRMDLRVVLSNSLGFGGHNCTVALARYES
jgi:3-oxoacyl-[acyl-carrier-protein] synthase II